MSKREPKVEWHVAKDDTDWAHLCTQPTQGMAQGVAPVAQDRSFAQQFFWEAAALLLLLAGVGGWAWRTDQGRTQQAAAQATMAAQPALDTIALV
ncbi:MAG TPA: hypothetical protein PKE45_04925, partial [Caldilineaceae bacterium]|nr:hypothetical protein [Caldilineaceae bacterium]